MSYKISQVIIDYSMEGNKSEPIPNLTGSTLVSELKQRIVDIKGVNVDTVRLSFLGKTLEDNKRLCDYRIITNSPIVALLRLKGGTQVEDKSRNMNPEFVKELWPEMEISKEFNCEANVAYAPRNNSCEEAEYYKAKMSCGHKWCAGCIYYYLDKYVNTNGEYEVKCPQSDCQKSWHLLECFAGGNVTDEKERIKFNQSCNKNGILKNGLGYFCPKPECGQFYYVDDQMKDRSDSQCPTCKYVFCQFCRLKWNNSNLCKSKKCNGVKAIVINELINSPKKEIWGVKGVPSKRLCQNPHCKTIYEHSTNCKRVKCPHCDHMQCHICNRRWIGRPCPGNGPCPCNYCKSLGEDAPEACSYNIKCSVVEN